jgi:polyisoprenoid-binding protein YceI
MKRRSFLKETLLDVLIELFFGILILGVLVVGYVEAAEYQVDPKHSSATWHINHFGFSNPSGKWMLNGTLDFDPAAPENNKANISVDVEKIITGLPDLEEHLKGKQFFEVEKFPKATFVSKKVNVNNNEITEISGDLTVHGLTRPVTFKVKQNKVGTNPLNDRPTIGFSAETTLKRSDFGILTLLPNLSDEVKLNIELEGYQGGA